MTLVKGVRLGPYEILAPIGAGGMGEVYHARDTRLDRTVAIKVLPAHLSASPELRYRLEREAKAISQLNHPHICTLHDVGREGNTDFLVMEYLEGETLAHRLEKGPLPLEQALRTASEIADALDTAHRQGIVHRDLKPGNVMLTKGGAKLLDFGLAKLGETGSGEGAGVESALPTQERPLTEEGKIVGTYPYMAPEQLEGQKADERTDIFAFGAVLYEMLTGQRAFEGKSRASLIAAILSSEPRPISELQPMTPPLLDRVVKRCLAKDPDERWQSAGDLAADLRWVADSGPAVGESPHLPSWFDRHARLAWAVSAALAVGFAVLVFYAGLRRPDLTGSPSGGKVHPVIRTVIELPEGAPLALGAQVPLEGTDATIIALSPDGSQLVYVGETEGSTQLYRRSMDSFETEPLPGTEGANNPFFSPDGLWVGFLTDDKVKKVPLRGGAPATLCHARAPMRASWVSDEVIYFSQDEGFALMRLPAKGGAPSQVAKLPAKFDAVLPDGKSVLLTRSLHGGISADYQEILVLSLETLEVRPLLKHGYDARYIPTGHLLYARFGSLFAVAFDERTQRVLGEPVQVVPGVSMQSLALAGYTQVAVSDTGELLYVPGGDLSLGQLAWVDRDGTSEVLPVEERAYGYPRLSPRGDRLSAHVADVNDYIWIYDLSRKTGRKLPVEQPSGWAIWTPDGQSLTFTSGPADGRWGLFRQLADGHDGAQELLSDDVLIAPVSWSPDGAVLGFDRVPAAALPRGGFLDAATKEEVLRLEPGHILPQFSPDGRWVAYSTYVDTGRFEVWVRSFPDGGTARQVSPDGGIAPLWCANGELFYRKGNRWMVTKPTLEPNLSWEAPRLAFQTQFILSPGRSYDISTDGQRLLVAKRTQQPDRTRLHVVHNWFEELKRLVPRE